MALAVVNYPTLSTSDFQWMQSVRKRYDRLFYSVVAPHFTLVFPTEIMDVETLADHIQTVAEQFASFGFIARCVTVGDPDFLDHAHVFLIPDEGFSHLVKLHDACYRGPLQSELRLDLPFVPHIGIASDPSPESCKVLVDQLNNQDFEIRGKVEKLDIIEYDGQSTQTVHQIRLTTR